MDGPRRGDNTGMLRGGGRVAGTDSCPLLGPSQATGACVEILIYW